MHDSVTEFRKQGFTMVRGFFSADETIALRDAIEQRAPDRDTHDALTDGGLVFNSQVYRQSTHVQAFLAQQRIIDFLEPIAGGDLWLRWDQAVSKHPGAGVFRWHQDNGYNQLLTEHYQLWIALTETRNRNGALWLAPGSHKRGRLPHIRASAYQVEVEAEIGETTCIDATIGDFILFSSLMLHRTGPNEADTTRVAYVAEYMPLADYDFYLKGPYFVVAENGVSWPHFIERQPGASRLRNQLLYARPRMQELIEDAKIPLRAIRDVLRAPLRRA